MSKVLFCLKRKEDYNAIVDSHVGVSTGLYNSATFVKDMLTDNGIKAKLSVLIDNNCIDRAVSEYKPTHVIIEALWVTPEKFSVLQKLHPTVQWIIRVHSEMPFMAGEGMAMDWIGEYTKITNVRIAINAPRMYREIEFYDRHVNNRFFMSTKDLNASDNKIIYLPNYYPQEYKSKKLNYSKGSIDVGCFGAIRPLKNHLVQAFAAIEFADSIGKKLNFHVNAGRIEMNGSPVINNLKGLFSQMYDKGHRLINHSWAPRDDFLKLCGQMDICLQVSFSETFNIVGADVISQGVPLVSCKEIPWAMVGLADPTDSNDIIKKLTNAYNWPRINTWVNQQGLTNYTDSVEKIWVDYFKD